MLDVNLVMLPGPNLKNPKMYYSLGVLYIASMLRLYNINVGLDDFRDKKPSELHGDMLTPARYTGFSATTGEFDTAVRLAQQVAGKTKTIIGGPHVSLVPQDGPPSFDVVVLGEGEFSTLTALSGARGVVKPERIKHLDSLPFPAWDLLPDAFSEDLFPGEKYGKGQRAATLIASRGCPFACAFCGNLFSREVVYRSPGNIIKEVQSLQEHYGIHHFRFEDDNFTLNKTWFFSLCKCLELMKDVKFKCHTRADLVDDHKLEALAKAGCVELAVALESADPDVLRLHKKGVTPQQVGEAIRLIKKHGMISKTYLISGLPGETEQTFGLTKAWFEEYQPDKWTLSRFSPYPGSDVWRHPDKYGVKWMTGYWEKYWNFYEDPPYILEDVDKETLNLRYKELYNWLIEHTSNMERSRNLANSGSTPLQPATPSA